MKINNITWKDPREKIWGFHIHQELPLAEFDRALVIQSHCQEFLESRGVNINDTDSMKPGYGPHLTHIWDLRVEHDTDPLEKMGLAISYLAINRFGLSAYIHPLMTNRELKGEQALFAEGSENQKNILWFTYAVDHYQEFFFNPPKDAAGKIVDTRRPRIMSQAEKDILYKTGHEKLKDKTFLDPYQTITDGFHIHMDYTLDEEDLALTIFDHFIKFLLEIDMRPTRTRLYEPFKNGPHIQHGWEVKFEAVSPDILRKIGIAVGWLMCNRHSLPIFLHPVTWREGDRAAELKAHEDYAMFIGKLSPLNLDFFRKLL